MSTGARIGELAGRYLPWIFVGVLVALAITQLRGGRTVPEGSPAPALAVVTDDGTHVDLAHQRGKLLVLNFWGTYCGPCRAEAPVLQRAHEKLAASGRGSVLGVAVDRLPLPDVAAFARRLGMLYPIAIGPMDALERYQVDVVPTTYIVGPDGRIRHTFVGAVSESALDDAID